MVIKIIIELTLIFTWNPQILYKESGRLSLHK
jgi:hypothetical protein